MKELKTYKDIQEEFKSDCTAKDYTESVLINKPLVGANAHYLDRLKQEAIKWIKELKNNNENYEQYGSPAPFVVKWIKHFFNITEEEVDAST